ncbi:hypothetical protein [Tardiphaga sp. 709]|uniref:hypothetical protein n=1 Tax=Tardiphaga sp. 709 TaxID=3076039 RepID=UPI0028E1AD84|nr:hypothetical protein [Tardiphaga sp. 709]WNV09989.1 hypothetical protein RSO67_01970 [Tardiphaga sp. 709]
MANFTYYVAMLDYGRRGREAIVDPNESRQNIIDKVKSGEIDRDKLIFIHEVTMGNLPVDVTEDVLAAAGTAELEAREQYRNWRWDHERDHHKNLVVL